MKSGLNYPGIAFGVPTENVLVSNITCVRGSRCGFAVGSEMSGGVRNVTFENSILLGQRDIHIKTSTGRGGLITGITYRNITSAGVGLSTSCEWGHARFSLLPSQIVRCSSWVWRQLVLARR